MTFAPPSKLEVLFRDHLAERDEHVSSKPEPHAWMSEAMTCSRKLAFRLMGTSEEEGIPLPTLLAWNLGSHIHEVLQEVLRTHYGATDEGAVDLGPITGRYDSLYEDAEGWVVVEIKSMLEWQFNRAQKAGPNPEHVMQANLTAYQLGAGRLHLIYVNKAARPSGTAFADWILPADPEAARLELERVAQTVEDASQGLLPAPYYPLTGEVILKPDPKAWPCSFCRQRQLCALIGPEPHQLKEPGAFHAPGIRPPTPLPRSQGVEA